MLAWISQERVWSHMEGRHLFESLARVRRLVTYDYRGMGASQRDAIPESPTEENVGDLFAVADALRIDTFDLFSIGPIGIAAAARSPARVRRLILFGAGPVKSGYSEKTVQMIRDQWGMYTRASASVIYPEGNAEALRWISDNARLSGGPDYIVANGTGRFDYRPLLHQIRCPTLLLHREHDQNHRLDEGRGLASHIAGARFVALSGGSHHPMWGCDDYLPILYDFLGAEDSEPRLKPGTISGTAIILFADIVDSTALTERMGDAAFRERARALDAALRVIISAAGGTAIDGKLLGDGVLATFPAASQAIDAALRCGAAGDDGGLALHLGIHAGDVIREADAHGRANVFGGAVNIASRISGLSAPGEVLVSEVVRALARTSASVTFDDRGEHALKGVGEPQRVYAVRKQA
jgi:class 3 adenylate cyclase/pimeloyl-ACP methyl ester carboxylesterase